MPGWRIAAAAGAVWNQCSEGAFGGAAVAGCQRQGSSANPGQEVGIFDGRKEVEISERIGNPLQWSAEKPNLYHLTIELRHGKTVLETLEREVGFRRIEILDRQLYVNGRRIKLAGACHHEFDPLTGRAATMRHAETTCGL